MKIEALCVSLCLWIGLCFAGRALGSLAGYPPTPRHPLEQAAYDGDLDQVKNLLAQEENEYVRNYALRLAVRGRHREVAELLISNGARNALYVAAAEGDVSLVKDLLARGSSENERDSALHAAAWGGHKEAAELLLAAGANVNATRFGDYTPLCVAAAAGCDRDTLQRFTNSPLSPWPANMTARKRSPVNSVAFRDVVELLIHHKADVNAREKQHGFVPLHYAVFGGSKEVVALLLDHGAPADPLAPLGSTAGRYLSPLHLAAHYGDLAICELLIARGADANSKLPAENKLWLYPTQRTPLHHAAASRNGQLVRFLLEQGAEINTADSEGQTPLLVASKHADPSVVETLLSRGADANAADREARTALHHAAERRDAAMVKTLLSHGADADRKSRDGQTPTSIATANGSEEIVRLLTNRHGRVTIHTAAAMGDLAALERLVKEGIDVNRLDVQGQTALHAAANTGQLAVVRWLVEHGANVDLADNKKATALSIATDQARAARRMTTEEVKYKAVMALLISRGASLSFDYGVPKESVLSHGETMADVVLASPPNGDMVPDANNTLLHWAAHGGNKQAVLDLIELGADLNVPNSGGATPLHYAIPRFSKPWGEDPYLRRHRDIVRLLIDRGAVVDPNSTILLRAADCSDVEIMDLLLAKGVDPNAATKEGITLLSVLLRSHWLTAEETKVRMKSYIMGLIWRGLRIDGQTADGVTTLQQAAALEFPDLFQELLSRGAPVNAKSNKGWTALHSAVAVGQAELVESLLKHGVEVNVVGDPPFTGWIPALFQHPVERVPATPLQIAISQGNDRIVELLIGVKADTVDPNLTDGNIPKLRD